jgi:hypothetical protein
VAFHRVVATLSSRDTESSIGPAISEGAAETMATLRSDRHEPPECTDFCGLKCDARLIRGNVIRIIRFLIEICEFGFSVCLMSMLTLVSGTC